MARFIKQTFASAGVTNILKNLKLSQAQIALRIPLALKATGLTLQAASQKAVPVDLGNLKASAFTRAASSGINTTVTVGYTARYALFVHELTEMKGKGKPRRAPSKGKYWDPQGRARAKFLQGVAQEMEPKLRGLFIKLMKRVPKGK
jgi:hypothetical protein